MPLMVWNDTLSVKVDEIDNQHKRLVELVNQLHDAMTQGKGREVMGKVLGGLIDYTKTHFADEERLMLKYNYPAYAQQKAEHDALTRQVLDLQSQYLQGKMTLTLEVMQFLQDWLSNHIQKMDRLFGVYLNSKGVK
jgi:hemerythrin